MDSSTKMREPAVQHWPALKNTPWWACSTARSTAGKHIFVNVNVDKLVAYSKLYCKPNSIMWIVIYSYKMFPNIFGRFPAQIWYLTPERCDPAVVHKGLTDPCDLWVSTEAPDWVGVHSPDLQALGSPSRDCWKHLKASAPPVWWAT